MIGSEMIRLRRHLSDDRLWIVPVTIVLICGLYFASRFGGYWAENDSAVFTAVIRNFMTQNRLVPTEGMMYANGYTYTVLAAFISGLTGLTPTQLQQIIMPATACLVALLAWLLFRELIGDKRIATVATVLLFAQPELLFVLLRSSHEKYTRLLILLCLLLIVLSIRDREKPKEARIWLILFCFPAFAMAASNNLLAYSFLFALVFTLGISAVMDVLARFVLRNGALALPVLSQRMFVASLITFVCVLLVTFVVYPPAQYSFSVIRALGNDSRNLFITGEEQLANPYAVVASGWIDSRVYLVLSSANWIVLGVAAIIWLSQGVMWLRGKGDLNHPMARLVWILFTAFAAQTGVAMVADAAGTVGGNLVHRLFPSISIMAVALVSCALAPIVRRRLSSRLSGPIRAATAIVLAGFIVLAMLKVTNEPVVSNMWMFYGPQEIQAVRWADRHLQNEEIWTEFSERLTSALLTEGISSDKNQFLAFDSKPTMRAYLVTDITRLRGLRQGRPLPIESDAMVVYDNGEGQLYRLRPQTPHQR